MFQMQGAIHQFTSLSLHNQPFLTTPLIPPSHPSLLPPPLPQPPQPPPNLHTHTHPRIHLLNPIPPPLLGLRAQTQRRKPQIAMIQIRPLVAGEFAETAHDRVLREAEEVGAQRGGVVEGFRLILREEREGGPGPEGVAGVGGLGGAAGHSGGVRGGV